MGFRAAVKGVSTAGLVLALFAGSLSAQDRLGVDFSDPTIDFTNGFWSLGFEFNVLAPVYLTGLGIYDDNKDGLTEAHAIGIWDPIGNLLASTTIGAGDGTLISWFRFSSVSPFLLAVGNGYRIAATTGSENYTWDPTGFLVDPALEFVADRFTQSETLVYPESTNLITGWFGANLLVSAVPEPATMSLLATGLLGLAGAGLWRRRRSAVDQTT